ncbi:MAG: glucose/sorbosone dehydrogenase family protein [Rhodobacteraceae bacterium HLUCCA12]|nr:MAG: glucose/sorbosone dehydrogenase family protein [Rhodobacteraceae bacterium HLUCCA12]
MTRPTQFLATTALVLAGSAGAALADYRVETLAEGLDRPWALAFLPGSDDIILTRRNGSVVIWDAEGGDVQDISGAPDVDSRGQGGLLDIAPAPDFEDSGRVYLTWSGANDDDETATHLGRARLDRDDAALRDLEVLHVVEPFMDSQGHYGSRIAFSDGHVFFSTGDRQSKDFGPDHIAQDLGTGYGALLRLNMDGSVPRDNPFVDRDGAEPAIWSYGHRNIQALRVHPRTGDLWLAEHGENGGDEINIVERGENYGWPLASHGVDYRTGEPFAPPHEEGDGFVAPVYHFGPGRDDNFPPSGMDIYDGDAFPDWQGHLLIGNLRHQYLGLFSADGTEVDLSQRLLEDEGWRIRDVVVGPQDGFIYVIGDGADVPLMRLVPDR